MKAAMTRDQINSMSPHAFCSVVSRNIQIRNRIIDSMTRFGGSFVKSLGAALACADMENAYKLAEAFPEYFMKYATWGTEE